jgi:hypothetical protein
VALSGGSSDRKRRHATGVGSINREIDRGVKQGGEHGGIVALSGHVHGGTAVGVLHLVEARGLSRGGKDIIGCSGGDGTDDALQLLRMFQR